jgi:FAD:protein FMN transferase
MESSSSIVIQHFNCSSMGTRFDFLTYNVDEGFFSSAKNFILNELERIEYKFSRFNEKSEIFRINQLAATENVTTDSETLSLLSRCREYYLKTNKLFDITVGKFTHKNSDAAETEYEPNTTSSGKEYSSPTGTDKIILDLKESAVRFSTPMLSIDLGGIGKGYALERINIYCIQNKITNALMSFGDSSITTIGTHPHGPYWPIGIQNGYTSGSPLHTFRLKDNSLSTSGNTPNNRMKFGSKGHILNPLTGEFQNDSRTISIAAASPMDAEVLSTTLFIAGEKDKSEILARFNISEAIGISYNQLNEAEMVDLKFDPTLSKQN